MHQRRDSGLEDTGKEESRTGGIKEKRDTGKKGFGTGGIKERGLRNRRYTYWTGEYRTGKKRCRKGERQKRRDAGHEGCIIRRIPYMMDSGKEGCRKEGMQDIWDSGRGMQNNKDSRQEGFRKGGTQ